MIRRRQSLTAGTLLLTLAVLSFGLSGKAYADRVITLAPTSVNQTILPGTSHTGEFKLINSGTTAYKYKVYVAPYTVHGEDYKPGFTYTPGTTKVSDWFTLGSTNGSLQPGQTIEVPYTIRTPAELAAGGYYAVIFAETQVPTAKAGVTLNQRVGELFYLQAPGNVPKQGDVLTWEAEANQAPPITAVARVQNSGGVHFAATAHFVVTDAFGSKKYTQTTKKYVLPQTIRKIDMTWNKAPSLGFFKIDGTVTILGKTHVLETKYVVVTSKPVRAIFATTTVLVVGLLTWSIVLRRRRRES